MILGEMRQRSATLWSSRALGRYALGMNLLVIEVFQSPAVWLWVVSFVVAVLLMNSMAGRRRVGLVETLREFVRRNQGPPTDKQTPAAENENDG